MLRWRAGCGAGARIIRAEDCLTLGLGHAVAGRGGEAERDNEYHFPRAPVMRDDELTEALLACQTENDELKKTITELRTALEEGLRDAEASERRLATLFEDERAQLTETVKRLRQELEKSFLDREDAVRISINDSRDEIKLLKETVATLRGALEDGALAQRSEIQAIENESFLRIKELEDTVRALRERMEADARQSG